MNTIRIDDLLTIHTTLVEVMADIDNLPPGIARAHTWHKLNTARNIIRVAIEKTGAKVEVKEAA